MPTSDGGPLLVREFDERSLIIENIMDDRRGKGHSGAAPGPTAPVRLQCLGRIRTCTRGAASITRPQVPLDRLPEDWERRAASSFSSLAQPLPSRTNGGDRRIEQKSGSMKSRRSRPTAQVYRPRALGNYTRLCKRIFWSFFLYWVCIWRLRSSFPLPRS
jgi:hypothetical protein